MKVYAVTSELYNQEPNLIVLFDSLDKAKKYLDELSKTFKEDCVHWHKTKELFKVSSPTSDVVDKFYIKEYGVL